MPVRGIVLGLGVMLVALSWWRVLRRRGRAIGKVTRRPRRDSTSTTSSTEVMFTVGGQSYSFHPSVVTNFDRGKLDVGTQVPVAYDESDPSSADLAEPWRMYAGPVVVTALCLGFAYFAFLGGNFPGGVRP